MNPSRVKSPLPAETFDEYPTVVRINPYTNHGWRPTSAVNHPAVLAMYGNGRQSMITQSSHRVTNNLSRQRRKIARVITAMKMVPSPAMMWYAKYNSGMFVGQSSRGNSFNPFTSAS